MKISAHVAVIGCGNIGVPLCDQLSRLPEIKCLTLVDPDSYSEENLRGQTISHKDIGRPKVRAMARRVREVRPDVKVVTRQCRVEDLPLGELKCHVICACLDSRASRMTVNEAACRLGVPWLDAGVLASEGLARLDFFLPGPDDPCLECAFGEQHYATMDVVHACQNGIGPATNAPAYLGAHAASLQAAACDRLLQSLAESGVAHDPLAGFQLIHNLRTHEHILTRKQRNSACRFDHRVLQPRLSGKRTLSELLKVGERRGLNVTSTITAPGKRFVVGFVCAGCGHRSLRVRCASTGSGILQRCDSCREYSPVRPELLHERLRVDLLSNRLLRSTPRSLGLRELDLFTVTDALGDRHYLVGDRENHR